MVNVWLRLHDVLDRTNPEHDFIGRYLILLLVIRSGLLLKTDDIYREVLTTVDTLEPSNVIIQVLNLRR